MFVIAVMGYASIASFGGGNMLDHAAEMAGGLIVFIVIGLLFAFFMNKKATGENKLKVFSIVVLIVVAIQMPMSDITITSDRLLLGLILGVPLALFFSAVVFMNKKTA